MAILSSKIKDQRFLQIIRKALNAGYMIDKQPIYDIVGTPQGSILSPILANIFLHQLDQYIEDLKADFDIIGNRKRNPIVRKLQWDMTKAKRSGDSKLIRQIVVKMRSNPNKLIGSGNRKLMYVRYEDDGIIAVNGRYSDASDILSKVTLFLKNMGITNSPTKTKIINTYKEPALFLGANFAHSQSVTNSLHKRDTIQKNSDFLVLSAPMKIIYNNLKEAGFMSNHRGVTRVT
jgi:retron-type reverse transcriptase